MLMCGNWQILPKRLKAGECFKLCVAFISFFKAGLFAVSFTDFEVYE